MARKIHSLQFKQEAVAMARSANTSVRAVAKSLGVRAPTLQYWIDHPPGVAQRCNGRRSNEVGAQGDDDPAALKLRLKEAEALIRRLEMERDILKKATAYFASQSP
jgi:transposase